MTVERMDDEVSFDADYEVRDELADDFGTTYQYGGVGGSISYVNEAGVSSEVIKELRENRDIASAIEKWSSSLHEEASSGGSFSLFNRGRWQDVKHPFAQMSRCAWAVENDEVLGTLCDVIESLMFQKMRFELYDRDQEDFWNQWAGTVNLDARMREMAREVMKCSQFYIGMLWESKSYRVRDDQVQSALDEEEEHRKELLAKREPLAAEQEELLRGSKPDDARPRGNRSRRKEFVVDVPTSFTIFDPTKILPVGSLMFGKERFAYIATEAEEQGFTAVMSGTVADGMVLQLVERKYQPTPADIAECAQLGVDHNRLWLLKADAVFRHHLTKAQYERFAPVRLKQVLPILEMKEHLRNADRAALIGATNFIIVITKGTDKHPARAQEIQNLQEQSRIIARLPVLVGDHRLNVSIVAPPLDNTLIESRWQVLDSRLVFRALNTFSPVVQGGNSSGTGLSEMSRVVARGLESRRHMLVRDIERHVFKAMMDRNASTLTEFPDLTFAPKRITLDFNADVLAQILKLRDRGDISRETTLEELDYDQDVEVVRRAREKAQFDHVFASSTPHASPATQPYAPGGQPGSPNGTPAKPGTAAPGQPQGVGPAGQPKEGGRPQGSRQTTPRKTAAAPRGGTATAAEEEDAD